jgi:hypothetical protein
MRIIQISGKGRVGKTTLAHLIAKYSIDLGYNPVILPFAAAIKQSAEEQGITKETDSSKYREYCQELGASKRAEDPDYWITRTFETIQEYMLKEIDNKQYIRPDFEYVIIQDDVRYMNELAFGRNLVATQIFVHPDDRLLPEHNAEWRNHESETLANNYDQMLDGSQANNYVDLFDILIYNGESLKKLEEYVKKNVKEWLDIGYLELTEIESGDSSETD